MADTKISSLPSLSGANAASNDELPIADVSVPATKAISLSELLAGLKLLGISLDDLSDVAITAAGTNDFLYYDGTTWRDSPVAASVVNVDSTSILNSAATDVQQTLVDLDAAVTNAAGSGIPATVFDAAGDILVGTAADTAGRIAIGSNNYVLGVISGALAYHAPRFFPQSLVADTTTAYTTNVFLPGVLLTLSNAAAITLTVAPNVDVALDVGTVIDFMQLGAGQVTVVQGAGVTINTASSLRTRAQYSVCSLVKRATNTWVLMGDLEPLGQTVNAQTGSTYTFVYSDMDKLVTASNGGAQTYTVPTNASVAYPVGVHIDLIQIGAGQVTIAAAGGVTVNATPTLKTRAQYSAITLIKAATDTWYVVGDLASS